MDVSVTFGLVVLGLLGALDRLHFEVRSVEVLERFGCLRYLWIGGPWSRFLIALSASIASLMFVRFLSFSLVVSTRSGF